MKEVVSAIRSLGGQLQEETVSSKYLRTLLPIYAIIVSAIQELRCVQGNTLTFEGIIGRLTTFELSNFTTTSQITLNLLSRPRFQ